MIFWRVLFGFLIAALVLGLGGWFLLFREIPQPRTDDSAYVFNHGSIGNERVQGMPYWLWKVLPDVFPEHLPADQKGWESLGFIWQDGSALPIGFSQKTLGTIPRISPNCAFCHQSSYRLRPDDQASFVAAGTGGQVNVLAFVKFLIAVGQDERFTAPIILDAIDKHYEMPLWERMTYEYILIPATRHALKKQAKDFEWVHDNPEWGLGRVDPFNPPKYTFLDLEDDKTIGNSDMMSVWNMQTADAKGDRRYFVHWDGLLSDTHETIRVGALGDGMTYQSYRGALHNLTIIEDYINTVLPPKSPFSSDLDPSDPYFVNAAQRSKGQEIYAEICAICHQLDGPRFRTPIPIEEVKTDPHRLAMWSQDAKDSFANYQREYDWEFDHFHNNEGYLAVDLTGLWLRGPYLHNGSVPNLRSLLLAPNKRPKVFYRGSDLVDTQNGGFISDKALDTLTVQWRVDTSIAGNSNSGHLWGTDLPAADKEALLAYLKTL